jgi:hypothetical protein
MKAFTGAGRLQINANKPQDVAYTIFVKRDRRQVATVYGLLNGLVFQFATGEEGRLTLDGGLEVKVVFTNTVGRSARVAVYGFEPDS